MDPDPFGFVRAMGWHDLTGGTQMKWTGLSILVLLLSTLNACPAQSSAETSSEQLPRKDETSQFRPDEVVVKIGKHHIDSRESLKRVGLAVVSNGGTGWCLGKLKCNLILTNYHVTERIGSPLKVNGTRVLQTFEATSSQDVGAIREKSLLGFSLKLVPVRDIAILRLEHSLKGMRGIPFSPRELHEGENVRIYGHPAGKELTMASAVFYAEAKDGLLFFKAKSGDEKVLIPGISGSLVVNDKNEAVGLVQGVANGNMA